MPPTLAELLQSLRGPQPMSAMGQMQPPTLAGLLGIGQAQAADTFQPNRGNSSYVAPPAYVGSTVAAAPDAGNQAKAQALRELQALGPPQMWHPSQQAANMARMQQLQAIVKGQMR